MTIGWALFFIFCTPLGWIGIVITGFMLCLALNEARS